MTTPRRWPSTGAGSTPSATAYGNPITFTPEDRAANAVDDDRRTAWQVGAFSPVQGERIELSYDEPRTTDSITVQQSDNGVQNRWITQVRLRFDGGDPVDIDLGAASRSEPGEELRFDRRTFRTLSIEVLARRRRCTATATTGSAPSASPTSASATATAASTR